MLVYLCTCPLYIYVTPPVTVCYIYVTPSDAVCYINVTLAQSATSARV
jgi:hypothetical protein